MRESGIQNKMLIDMSKNGLYGLRINSGEFWGGKFVSMKTTNKRTFLVLENPTKVQGAPAGTSDIIGCKSVFITPQMVGTTLAVFFAVEVKCPGKKPEPHQENYLAVMRCRGAIAGSARSSEEMLSLLGVPNG